MSAGPRVRRRRRISVLALLLFVLAVILRLALVEHHSLWGDEVFSLATATGHSLEQPAAVSDPARGDFVDQPTTLTPHELAQYAKHQPGPVDPMAVIRAARLSDTSPPLYYLLLAYWTHAFGTGDAALRMFSVICSLIAFPLLWSLAGELGGRRARAPVALLYAVTPLAVYLSTEGRMYSFLWLMATVNLWATVRLTRAGHRGQPAMLALWVLSSIAGLYTHYFFNFVWVPTCAWMLLRPGRTGRAVVVTAATIAMLAAAPWYIHLPADMKAWRVTAGWQEWVPYAHRPWLALIRLPFHFVTNNGCWAVRPQWEALNILTFAALIATALWTARRAMFSHRRLLPWVVACSACILLLGSDFARGTYAYANERYVATGLPAALILFGTALARIHRPALRTAFLVMIVFLSMVGFRKIWLNNGRQIHPVREMASALRQFTDNRDLVLLHAIPSAGINLARYLESPDGSQPRVDAPVDGSLPRVATWVGQLGAKTSPDDMGHLAAGHRQVVYVRYHDLGAEPIDQQWLAANGRVTKSFFIGKIPAIVYRPRSGDTF